MNWNRLSINIGIGCCYGLLTMAMTPALVGIVDAVTWVLLDRTFIVPEWSLAKAVLTWMLAMIGFPLFAGAMALRSEL